MSRSRQQTFEQSFRVRDAEHLLQRHHVRSRIACYVNPNAICPVCSQTVFFYANAAGSRVFFDDLGPPWPKHPCTDQATGATRTTLRIERRSSGLIRELVDAASATGMLDRTLGTRSNATYTPIVVLVVVQGKDSATITGEYIDSVAREGFQATVRASDIALSVGDIIGVQNGVVSFIDPITLQPMQFRDGGPLEAFRGPSAETKPTPKTQLSPKAILIKRRNGKLETSPPREPTDDPTPSEMQHFGTDEKTFSRLLATYSPVIRQYARENVRKPKDVWLRLDREGHRTMAGGRWTTRLVFYLLKFLFSENPGNRRHEGQPKPEGPQRPQTPRAPARTPDASKESDVAAKLAVLGRVTNGKSRRP